MKLQFDNKEDDEYIMMMMMYFSKSLALKNFTTGKHL